MRAPQFGAKADTSGRLLSGGVIPSSFRRHRSFLRSRVGQAGGRAVIHHVSAGHADDARRVTPRKLDIVDVDDDGDRPLTRDLLQDLHDLDRRLRIEGGGGLIGQNDIGLLHDGTRDADALTLSARQGIGALGCRPRKPHRIQEVEGPLNVAFGKFAQPCAPDRNIAEAAAQQILHDGQALDEIVLLEHHADATARVPQGAA